MSKTTSDRRFAARIFALVGGVLLGVGLAIALYGWMEQPYHPIVGMVYLVIGAVAAVAGIVLSFTSVAVRGPHRIGHLIGWVIVPAVLAFVGSWLLLKSTQPI